MHLIRILVCVVMLLPMYYSGMVTDVGAQSRPQRPNTTGAKKNKRPTPKTPEQIRKEKEAAEQAAFDREAIVDDEEVVVDTKLVNVDTVVYDKKSKRIITGLTKDNFAVFEDGVEQKITNFSMPDAPITVTLLVEYSRWSEIFGQASGGRFEAGHIEVIRPVAQYLSSFIRAPDDYASVVAFDMRPTPITDFTNDPNRLRQTVTLLLRNRPAFRENNLFDAMNFVLVGGKGDAVVLEGSEERSADYGGMVSVKSGRRAIILIASGIDTFSKINYKDVRNTIQNAGIPIFIISTGNLFYKKYEHLMDARDTISGFPGRLTFLQAKNAMNTFARESGGEHFEMTFPGEVPSILRGIDALMRNQYSIAYDANEEREPDKKYKLEVRVDVNGDGKYDNKKFEVKHRPFFRTPKEKESKKK